MSLLYITSLSDNSGKTMLSAGLAQHWCERGKKIGYLKLAKTGGSDSPGEADVRFMHKLLGLSEPLEALLLDISSQTDTGEAVRQASEASRDKDVVIIEGLPLKESGGIIQALDARVMVVHDYSVPLAAALPEYQKLGDCLSGVVVNKVPRNRFDRVRSRLSDELKQAGIGLLGLIPEHRLLMTLTIGELAEAVQGKLLNSPDKADELIENFMMGSSTFDRGAAYYNRKENKAVILWGGRPGFRKAALAGLQQAALQTSVKCIVISADGVPAPAVAQKAEEKGVPTISAPGTVPELIESLEKAMGRLRFNQEKKLPYLRDVMSSGIDLKLLSRIVGTGN